MQHAHAGRNIFGWYAFESIAVCRDGAVCKWCPLLRQRDDVFAGIVGSRRRTSPAAIRLHAATTIASPAMPDSCASSTWVSHRASSAYLWPSDTPVCGDREQSDSLKSEKLSVYPAGRDHRTDAPKMCPAAGSAWLTQPSHLVCRAALRARLQSSACPTIGFKAENQQPVGSPALLLF